MENYTVFEYVIYYVPTDGENVSPTVITRDTVVEIDERTALMRASRSIPDIYSDKLNQVKIAIRPF